MAKKKGICRNFDNCDLADSKEVQEVESTEFVCAECGKPLTECGESKHKKKSNKPLLIIIALIIIAAIVGCILLFGKKSAPQSHEVISQVDSTFIKARMKAKADSIKALEDSLKAIERMKAEMEQAEAESNQQKEETKPVAKDGAKKQNAPLQNSGTLTLSYGKYTGSTKNGYPHGQGRLTYTKERQINKNDVKARKANAGDYVIGEFYNGFVVYGKHYDSSGNLLGSLNFGVGSEDSYDSK